MRKRSDVSTEDFEELGIQYIVEDSTTTQILDAIEEALVPFDLELEVYEVDGDIKGVKVVK